MPAMLKLDGQRFGRLTVVRQDSIRAKGFVRWVCLCDCGAECVVKGRHLATGKTRSCGCLMRDKAREAAQKTRTHGYSKTPLYRVWAAIKNSRTRDPRYARVQLCDRWKKFENFLADMGDRPSNDHSVERIDNDGAYSPENCRWATQKEQMNNTRSNVFLEWNGQRKTLKQWSEHLGLSYPALGARIRAGWPVERALTQPLQPRPRR